MARLSGCGPLVWFERHAGFSRLSVKALTFCEDQPLARETFLDPFEWVYGLRRAIDGESDR